jgi:hypothetical protein
VTTSAARAVDRRFPSCAGPGDDDDETPIGDPDLDDDDDEDDKDDDDDDEGDEGDTMWAGATVR